MQAISNTRIMEDVESRFAKNGVVHTDLITSMIGL